MLSTLIVFGMLAPQAATVNPPATDVLSQAYYLVLQAHAAEERNDLTTAVVNYRQALDLLPNSSEIHIELAGLYVQQGQVEDGEREARAALAIDASRPEAHRILGWIQAATLDRVPEGQRDAVALEATRHLERAIQPGKSDPPAQIALASLYVRGKDGLRAEALLTQILTDQPELPAALRLQALAFQLQGRQEEADRVLAILRDADPDPIETRVRQIQRLERGGGWAQAVAMWAEVVIRTDGGALYRPQYAVALANNGAPDKARALLTDAARDAPRDPSPWYLLAQIEAREKNAAAAENAARRIAEIDPADLRGPLAQATARASRNDYRGIVRALNGRIEKARDRDLATGYFEEIARELNAAHVKLGQPKDGIETLERATRRAPANMSLQFMLAAAYEQNQQYDSAERAFRDLLAKQPAQPQVLNYLGYMLADRGQKLPEALDLIKRALVVDPENPSYLDSLGWAHFKMGNFNDAQVPLERAAAALPHVSVIQDHLGDLYLSLKRFTQAIEAFGRALGGDRDGIDVAAITKKRDHARTLAAQP